MAPIRVAAITFDWYPFDIRVRRMAEAAVDAGYEMDVICLRPEGEQAFEVCNGVRVYRMPMDRGFGRSLPATLLEWLRFSAYAAATITRLHRQRRYDVIVAHNMPDFLIFAAALPKFTGAKLILDVQDTTPELMAAKASGRKKALLKRAAGWQERISTAFADAVITVGWPFEEVLLQRGVPQRKITLVLNSADPRIFPPERRIPAPADAGMGDRPFIVMYHGTLAERNGLATAVRALKLALPSAPNLRLDIMGRGEALPELHRLAAELGVADRVVFTDPCPTENIVDFVLHGDVGIIPYRCDGFADLVLPTKAYELAFMRRALIASDTPAIRSMFGPDSILLCDPTSPESFAEAIVELYHHPEKRARMIENAARDYEPYRWEAMRERYQALLRSLSRGEHRGPEGISERAAPVAEPAQASH